VYQKNQAVIALKAVTAFSFLAFCTRPVQGLHLIEGVRKKQQTKSPDRKAIPLAAAARWFFSRGSSFRGEIWS
jgi:hypothetical protein